MDRCVIAGYREIGKAVHSVLTTVHKTAVVDIDGKLHGNVQEETRVDVLHICFPYSDSFVHHVADYQARFNPEYTVIHSSVPVGTSSSCGAIHSPVVGTHPHLAKSLLTFTKFIGGDRASGVADHFRRAGIRVYITDRSESTELLKLDSTTWYGTCIEKTKDTKELFDEHGVPFELFTIWTDSYNRGYQALGQPQFTRPNLTPIQGKIGGHCVLPNARLIGKTRFTEAILERNQECE